MAETNLKNFFATGGFFVVASDRIQMHLLKGKAGSD
jgi:hypothetical protein